MSTKPTDDLMPLPELSRKVGVSHPTLWRAAVAGEIACIQQGRRYLAVAEDVARWAAARKGTGR
jgi:hypothetical protein